MPVVIRSDTVTLGSRIDPDGHVLNGDVINLRLTPD